MADKKILQEEMLDDEQLEKVAGGSWGEMLDDQYFFSTHGIHSYLCAGCDVFTYKRGVEEMWKSFGIEAKIDMGDGKNKYSMYIDGDIREISREEAMNHVNKIMEK